MVKYSIGSRVKVTQQGKFNGLVDTIMDVKGFNSGFPGDKTVWTYAVRMDTDKTKWFSETFLIEDV